MSGVVSCLNYDFFYDCGDRLDQLRKLQESFKQKKGAYKKETLRWGVAKAKRNGHRAFRSKSVHAKPFALRAFHFNPSPATQFLASVILKYTPKES